MKILGIHDGHNASAALVDGRIVVSAVGEERFTYRKNKMGFPERTARHSLESAVLSGADLDELAAAIHPADHTARAHIVTRELNPGYWDLIQAFAKRTGVGALLNTSFNLHGLPIVRAPEHAVHVFKNSRLDAILIEDVLVARAGVLTE